MAKIEAEGKLPKRIGNYVIYELQGQKIIRTISGFTSKALKKSPKYALSRQNASEFGRVSSLCKQVRMVLKGILPKNNNLLIVNTFTKKMREVMTFDPLSARGSRNLAVALEQDAGKKRLVGYCFNPEADLTIAYVLHESSLHLTTTAMVFPESANCVGFRVHDLEFDFRSCNHQLEGEDWSFYSKQGLPEDVVLALPKLDAQSGVVFTLLEVEFYVFEDGSYVPVADDRSKQVLVVGCV